MLIDTQCHVSPDWYEPVESLLEQMTRGGVSQAVLVQMLGQTDNLYQQECVQRYPEHFASVVLVDVTKPGAVTALSALAQEGATGVRLRPTDRSVGDDPYAIWRCASELGLAVSCVGNPTTFTDPAFASLIAQFPNLAVVLEHLGGTSIPDKDDASRQARMQVMQLSRFANLYMKVPGLGELVVRRPLPAHTPFAGVMPETLQVALSAFGPERLMWGSDFPVVSSREGYANSHALMRRVLEQLNASQLDDIFGNVARRIFKLPATRLAKKLSPTLFK